MVSTSTMRAGRLYAACDDGALVEVDSRSGEVTNVWPIAGPPDVTFFNPRDRHTSMSRSANRGWSKPSIREPA